MKFQSPLGCVLLIDDDRLTSFYNEKIVNKHNAFKEVVSVNSGANALDYLKNAIEGKVIKPELIFLDINMPAMNGWEFLKEFNNLDKTFINSIKVILLTTSSNPDDYTRSKENDLVDDFINKPLSISVLSDVLTSHYASVKEYVDFSREDLR